MTTNPRYAFEVAVSLEQFVHGMRHAQPGQVIAISAEVASILQQSSALVPKAHNLRHLGGRPYQQQDGNWSQRCARCCAVIGTELAGPDDWIIVPGQEQGEGWNLTTACEPHPDNGVSADLRLGREGILQANRRRFKERVEVIVGHLHPLHHEDHLTAREHQVRTDLLWALSRFGDIE